MSTILSGIILLLILCAGLAVMLLRDAWYRKSKEKLGMSVDPSVDFLLGDTIAPIVNAQTMKEVAVPVANKHQLGMGIFFILAGITAGAFGLGYLAAGFVIISACLIASWTLQRRLPNYDKNSVVSQLIFGLIILAALALAWWQVHLYLTH